MPPLLGAPPAVDSDGTWVLTADVLLRAKGQWLAFKGFRSGPRARIVARDGGQVSAESTGFVMQLGGAERLAEDDTGQRVAWARGGNLFFWSVGQAQPGEFQLGRVVAPVMVFAGLGGAQQLHVITRTVGGHRAWMACRKGQPC
jgi:hypothetical protein